MSQSNDGQKSKRGRRSMVGCGTAEIMFRDTARTILGKLPGVVRLTFAGQRIIVDVEDEQSGEKLPRTFRRRRVQYQVVGKQVKANERVEHPSASRCEGHSTFVPAPSQLPLDICPACKQLKLIAPFTICKTCSHDLQQCEMCGKPSAGSGAKPLTIQYTELIHKHKGDAQADEVVSFRRKHSRNLTFRRRAKTLDRLALLLPVVGVSRKQ